MNVFCRADALCKVGIEVELYLKAALLFTPVYGKHAVILDFRHDLCIIGVHSVCSLAVIVDHLRLKFAVIFKQLTQLFSELSIIGNDLGNYILCAVYGRLSVRYVLLLIYVLICLNIRIALLHKNKVCKSLQSALNRNRCPRLFLLLIGTIDVLHLSHCYTSFNGGFELLCHLALIGYRLTHFFLTLFKIF